MPKVINLTADALDETNPADGRWVKIELRDQDENGNALSGTDKVYVTVCVVVSGDDGSTRKEYVSRQLASIPTAKLSNQEKLDLLRFCKKAYSAAVKVATDDDV